MIPQEQVCVGEMGRERGPSEACRDKGFKVANLVGLKDCGCK
jgi:hypothetical protein